MYLGWNSRDKAIKSGSHGCLDHGVVRMGGVKKKAM